MPPLEQIHPMVVHFPIVFVLSLLAIDLWSAVRGLDLGRGGGAGNLAAGVAVLAGLAALVAFVFGDQAYDIAVAHGTPMAPLEAHEGLGTPTAFLILGWGVLRGLIWWLSVPVGAGRRWLAVLVDAVLVGMILTTAWYGGRLVYEFGVAVQPAAGG